MVSTYRFLEPSYQEDAALILETMNSLWDALATDAQQGMRLSFVPTHNLHYVAAYWQDEFAGMWVLNELKDGVLDVHTLILPGFTGHAVTLGHGALQWAFAEGVADRLSTKVPGFNHGARLLTEAMGFIAEPYTDPEPYRKHGVDWAVQTYTLTKEQYYAHRSNRRRSRGSGQHPKQPHSKQGAETSSGPSPPSSQGAE